MPHPNTLSPEMIPATCRKVTKQLFPYFGRVIFATKFVDRTGTAGFTMACDKNYRIYYDSKALAEFSAKEIVAIFVHEINHLVRKHFKRGTNRKAMVSMNGQTVALWNVAADLEINDDLRGGDYPVPPSSLFPDTTFGLDCNLSAEEYYDLLEKKVEKEEEQKPSQSGKGDSSEGEKEQGDGTPELTDKKGKSIQDVPTQSSASDGVKKEYELKEGAEEAPAVADWEKEVIEKEVAAEIQKQVVKIPGRLKKLATEILTPKINWKNELNRFVRRAIQMKQGISDYTYQRRHPRQPLSPKIVYPGFYTPEVNVTVLIDTSGSMHDVLNKAAAEIRAIAKAAGAKTLMVHCDAKVHGVSEVKSQIEFKGGGGTDLRKGYEYIATMKQRTSIIICVTDAETPWPEKANRGTTNVCVVINDSLASYTRNVIPKWFNRVYELTKEDYK